MFELLAASSSSLWRLADGATQLQCQKRMQMSTMPSCRPEIDKKNPSPRQDRSAKLYHTLKQKLVAIKCFTDRYVTRWTLKAYLQRNLIRQKIESQAWLGEKARRQVVSVAGGLG